MKMHVVTLTVKIRTTDEPSQTSTDDTAKHMAIHLNRGFGNDRVQILDGDKLFVFDPKVQDGEHNAPEPEDRWVMVPRLDDDEYPF